MSETSKALVEADIERQVFELLVEKAYSFSQVADALDMTRARAVNIAKKVLEDIRLSEHEVREWRIIMNHRFDHWLQKLEPKIETGDVQAINTAIRLEERRAEMLGLDKPTKVDVTHHVASKDPQAAARRQKERLEKAGFAKITTRPPAALLPAPKEPENAQIDQRISSKQVDLGAA